MASVTACVQFPSKPSSTLRPASVCLPASLFLPGWSWCGLTGRGRSLRRAWMARQPLGCVLNRGTRTTLCRVERSLRAPLHPPPPLRNLPSSWRTWSCADRSLNIVTIILWKSLLLDMLNIQPAVVDSNNRCCCWSSQCECLALCQTQALQIIRNWKIVL